jgi:TfoX/Sxy family transcriptional regulator of competence genes
MAKLYLDDLTALIERAAPAFADGDVIACRHLFGGAAAYVNGRIFMSLTPVGLALKLPELRRDALKSAGGAALRYFPNGPVKVDYVVLPEAIMARRPAFAELIVESAEYARAQPLPKKKVKAKGPFEVPD